MGWGGGVGGSERPAAHTQQNLTQVTPSKTLKTTYRCYPGCQRNGSLLFALNLPCCENWERAEKSPKVAKIVSWYQYDGILILNQILWTKFFLKHVRQGWQTFVLEFAWLEILVYRTTEVDNQRQLGAQLLSSYNCWKITTIRRRINFQNFIA